MSDAARETTPRLAAARVEGLSKVYGSGETRVVALDDVTLDLYAGEFTAIMGKSGSGKSTLMHCAAGLDEASAGHVFVGDVDLTTLKERALTELRRDRIGFVFQAFNLVPTLTARENIVLPAAIAALLVTGCGSLLTPQYARPDAPVPQNWPTQGAYAGAVRDSERSAIDTGWKTFVVDARARQLVIAHAGACDARDLGAQAGLEFASGPARTR